MPAPDAPEDQQAYDTHDTLDDRPAGRCLRLSRRRLLGVVSKPLVVGAGGELVDGTGAGLARSRVEICSAVRSGRCPPSKFG
jgi:hypothetical protein